MWNVSKLWFKEAGQTSQQQQQQSKTDIPSTSITMMDLIVAMAKYVPESSHNHLLLLFLW